MEKTNNTIGTKMQIRFSREFVHLSNKNNLESGIDYETEIGNIIDISRNIARVAKNVKKENLELYAYFYGLGKIEYGDKGLGYINQQLPENVTAITELEMSNHNLRKIFPDFETTIGKELFDEYRMLYQDSSHEPEIITILKLSILLEKISQGVKRTISEITTKEEAVDVSIQLKFDEIKKIKEEYQKTGIFKPTSKMKDLLIKIDRLYSNYQLTETQKTEIENVVQEVLKTAKDRGTLLDGIFSFNSQLNKKKMRGK